MELMLVDLSGKVVHRGLLLALISSGCRLLPSSDSPADFTSLLERVKLSMLAAFCRVLDKPSSWQGVLVLGLEGKRILSRGPHGRHPWLQLHLAPRGVKNESQNCFVQTMYHTSHGKHPSILFFERS